jgi:hypothetical protein
VKEQAVLRAAREVELKDITKEDKQMDTSGNGNVVT